MLELQKIFLLVKFFNQISCNKSSKATISCFFLCFFCLTPLRLKCSRSRKTTSFLTTSYMHVSCKLPYCMSGVTTPFPLKDHFISDVTWAEEIQKSGSTELHEWSENMVNVENCPFLKENCKLM